MGDNTYTSAETHVTTRTGHYYKFVDCLVTITPDGVYIKEKNVLIYFTEHSVENVTSREPLHVVS